MRQADVEAPALNWNGIAGDLQAKSASAYSTASVAIASAATGLSRPPTAVSCAKNLTLAPVTATLVGTRISVSRKSRTS